MTKSKKHKCAEGKVHHYLIEESVDAQARWVKNGSSGIEGTPGRNLRGTCTFCGYKRYFPASAADSTHSFKSKNDDGRRNKLGSLGRTPNRYAEE